MESSLTNAVPESPAEKGLTAEEEKDLDTIMQSLDIDSSGSDIDENEDLGARDFTEEFGLSPVSFDHSSHQNVFIPTNPHSTLSTNTSKTTIPLIGLHTQHSVYSSHTSLTPTGYKAIFSSFGWLCFSCWACDSFVIKCVTFSFSVISSVDASVGIA